MIYWASRIDQGLDANTVPGIPGILVWRMVMTEFTQTGQPYRLDGG